MLELVQNASFPKQEQETQPRKGILFLTINRSPVL